MADDVVFSDNSDAPTAADQVSDLFAGDDKLSFGSSDNPVTITPTEGDNYLVQTSTGKALTYTPEAILPIIQTLQDTSSNNWNDTLTNLENTVNAKGTVPAPEPQQAADNTTGQASPSDSSTLDNPPSPTQPDGSGPAQQPGAMDSLPDTAGLENTWQNTRGLTPNEHGVAAAYFGVSRGAQRAEKILTKKHASLKDREKSFLSKNARDIEKVNAARAEAEAAEKARQAEADKNSGLKNTAEEKVKAAEARVTAATEQHRKLNKRGIAEADKVRARAELQAAQSELKAAQGAVPSTPSSSPVTPPAASEAKAAKLSQKAGKISDAIAKNEKYLGRAQSLAEKMKVLKPVAVVAGALDVYGHYQRGETAEAIKAGTEIAGSFAGAEAGAYLGGMAGAAVGSIVPGIGTGVVGALGALAGGVVGGIWGEDGIKYLLKHGPQFVSAHYDNVKQAVNTASLCESSGGNECSTVNSTAKQGLATAKSTVGSALDQFGSSHFDSARQATAGAVTSTRQTTAAAVDAAPGVVHAAKDPIIGTAKDVGHGIANVASGTAHLVGAVGHGVVDGAKAQIHNAPPKNSAPNNAQPKPASKPPLGSLKKADAAAAVASNDPTYFENGSAVLSDAHKNYLASQVKTFKNQIAAGKVIEIDGGASSRGWHGLTTEQSQQKNLALSQSRAQAAIDYLVKEQGFKRDDFVAVGLGEVGKNATAQANQSKTLDRNSQGYAAAVQKQTAQTQLAATSAPRFKTTVMMS